MRLGLNTAAPLDQAFTIPTFPLVALFLIFATGCYEIHISVLGKAVHEGNLRLVRAALDSGHDVNAPVDDDNRALHYAASSGDIEIAQLLLDRGAEVNVRGLFGFTPLIAAAIQGHSEMVCLLLRRGANSSLTSRRGEDAAFWAQKQGHSNIVLLLSNPENCPRQ